MIVALLGGACCCSSAVAELALVKGFHSALLPPLLQGSMC